MKTVCDSDEIRAVVREVDGQLVLDDPDMLAVARVVDKHNCINTLNMNADRVAHFKQRMVELGATAQEVVIVLLNADDVNGGLLAEALMPRHDWQVYRDRKEVPFARGLAGREGIQAALCIFDEQAATKLREMIEVAVVVVDHGVAEVFPA